jgi:hypothetical protein
MPAQSIAKPLTSPSDGQGSRTFLVELIKFAHGRKAIGVTQHDPTGQSGSQSAC